MSKKKTAQKAWSKIAFGILFVISCFIAMYILIRFYEEAVLVGGAAALLLISAYLFLNAIFGDKEKMIALQEEEEAFLNRTSGEFQLKIAKHMKEVEKNQKEMLEVLKDQSNRMESKLGDVQHEVYLFSEKQISQTKSIIKYNKENARQLAISERETLEYVMHELKEAVENKATAETHSQNGVDAVEENMVAREKEVNPVSEEIMPEESLAESIPEAESAVEEPLAESIPEVESAAEKALEESVLSEEFELPELPEDLDLSSLFDIPELNEEAPEDIAKLLESMGK